MEHTLRRTGRTTMDSGVDAVVVAEVVEGVLGIGDEAGEVTFPPLLPHTPTTLLLRLLATHR